MFRFNFFKRDKNNATSIRAVIKKIQNGDKALREDFIKDYVPFILKSVSQFTGSYVEIENSEEYSVGLSAFNEAIDSFDETMNCSFLTFASQVIKRRLINYSNKNQKNNKVYPFTYFETDTNSDFEERYLSVDSNQQFDNVEISEQIFLFEKKLLEFGISMKDLVSNSPKHRDSKQLCIKIAKMISERDHLFQKLDRKKSIPMSELMNLVDVSQRTIERNRKFIIAVCLILRGDYDILTEFVQDGKKGGTSFE